MVKIGSPHNFAKHLLRADRIKKALWDSKHGVRHSQVLQGLASEMSRALRENDFAKLLYME